MNRLLTLTLATILLLGQTLRAEDLSNNAALQYWQAIAVLYTFSADQQNILQNCQTVPIEQARQLVGTPPDSLKLMQIGRAHV